MLLNRLLISFLVLFSAKLAENSKSVKPSAYVPDLSINRKVFLDDDRSGKAFYRCKVIDDGFRQTPCYLYTSSESKQYLVCCQYEGNASHNFSQFEFGYVSAEISKRHPCVTKEKTFFTESGVRLGLSYAAVVKLKGHPAGEVKGPNTVLEYKMPATSAFVKKHGMPGYSMSVYFKNNLVNKVVFGFDYP